MPDKPALPNFKMFPVALIGSHAHRAALVAENQKARIFMACFKSEDANEIVELLETHSTFDGYTLEFVADKLLSGTTPQAVIRHLKSQAGVA